jgi:hypothetical protein
LHAALCDLVAMPIVNVAELAPAPAQEPERTTEETTTMLDTTKTTEIEQKAAAFLRRLPKNYTTADVVNVSRQYPDEGDAYRLAGIGATWVSAAGPSSINLSVREGETFDALAMRYAHEHGVTLRQAVHEVGKARPDLAAARG